MTTLLHTFKYRSRRKVSPLQGQPQLINEALYVSVQDEPFDRHAFNAAASHKLRCDRPVPDTRHRLCKDLTFQIENFQTTSVVITFYNEARSALLRTVVSVLNRTPSELLEEILLIDDCSDNEEDGALLTSLPKVHVIRNKVREGLIRSRILGTNEAKGDYIMFLDSHCEVNIGWLEPLLERVMQDQKTVASPVIDVIDLNTFHYRASSAQLKGGFDWSLHFKWIPLSKEERAKKTGPTEPFLSPTVAGGLFLVNKEWLMRLGTFDSGLDIWGGESLEISLKTWLCGGHLEVVPCSRIGHVFRKKHPYTFPEGNALTYLRNSKRIADVWLDEYRRFFYEARPNSVDLMEDKLDEQLKIKEQLNCKPFQWYLENVFPELKLPNEENSAFGQLIQGTLCLQSEGDGSAVVLSQCSENVISQHGWAYSTQSKAIHHNSLCLTVPRGSKFPQLQTCQHSPQQEWSRQGRSVILISTSQCMESGITSEVLMSDCRHGAVSQQWDFAVELQVQYDPSVQIT